MKFQDLRLSEPLLRAIGEKGYTDPTPIQQQAIPPVLEGRDLQGCAQTGTGKTAAFTLPMLQLLAAEPAPKGRRPIRALVLTPTRELAIQIDECCRDYARYTPIRHCVIFGGVNQRPQVDALQKGVDLLVATPGRLLDLIGQGYVTLDTIRFFVLDEADRMLDMGFIHDIRRILPLLPERRQTLFFSATMPESIAALAAKILRNPVLVTVTPPASVVETIAQTVHFAEKAEKSQLLIDLLSASDAQQVLVFSRTKHGADKLAKILNRAGIRSCAIHGNKSQNARVKAMNDFKSGECRVMIATDIAARGIDIDQLPLVINYELPEVAETYVHRIGRTGRAGHEGAAWSFCSEDEFEYLCDIQKLTGLTIPTEGPAPEYALRKAAPARKPAQKAAQRPARTQEPKPARNAGAKSAQRPARDADAGQQPAQRPARNTEQKAARNAAKTPQSAQNPAQPE
uniref:DEAD/DEAH box helicase n=1 Tax=Alistipes shahii TaxID=328814 RepID=UPI003AF01D6A